MWGLVIGALVILLATLLLDRQSIILPDDLLILVSASVGGAAGFFSWTRRVKRSKPTATESCTEPFQATVRRRLMLLAAATLVVALSGSVLGPVVPMVWLVVAVAVAAQASWLAQWERTTGYRLVAERKLCWQRTRYLRQAKGGCPACRRTS